MATATGRRVTPKQRHHPRAGELVCGPFRGVRDSTDPTTADSGLARRMVNMYRASGPPNASQRGRPGCALMGTAAGTVVQAGPMTWTNASGTRQTVRVVDGEVYAYNWGTDAWTKVISTANLSTASAALSTTARVALVPFADKLIVSDGTNFAIWWDGTSGAGGITELPVKFEGPPTVYYSKLVGIDATRPYVLFWSEEGDATIGYDITVGPLTYTNAWDNPGGYTEPLTAVCGTNDGLYVFRERITVAILGAMGADFQTAGTRANISPDIGTLSPYAVFEIAQGVFFVDADANPWVVRIGLPQPVPLWQDCLAEVRDVPRLSLPQAWALYDECTAQLVLGLSTSGVLSPSKWLTFHADDLQYNGVGTTGVEMSTAGMVIDADGVKRWAHSEATGGASMAHGTPRDGPWTDHMDGAEVSIPHEIIGPYLAFDPAREFKVNRGEFGFTAGSEVTVGYETSRGRGSLASLTIPSGSRGFILDVDLLDQTDLGGLTTSSQAAVGWAGQGRWVSTIVRHDVSGEEFGLDVQRVHVGHIAGNPQEP